MAAAERPDLTLMALCLFLGRAPFPINGNLPEIFFRISDKNIIPVNDLRGEFPPSEREFIGHERELNRRDRELSGNAGAAAT